MSHVTTRGKNGRRHEVDPEGTAIVVELLAGEQSVGLRMGAPDEDRPWQERWVAPIRLPRHLFGMATADLARDEPAPLRVTD